MHVVRIKKLGVPQSSRHAFELIEQAGLLDITTANQMKAMIGFRNTAVDDYQKINFAIMRSILTNRLVDFVGYTKVLIEMSTL